MHPSTTATLKQLQGVEWFRKVGVQDTETAIVLSSWEEAIESCGSPEWGDLCLEAANQYCERLVERSIDRWRQWNETVDEVKPFTEALVAEKTNQYRDRFPKQIFDTIRWDILHLAMECEYQDVFPASFYTGLSYWYWSGHFPCGWRGPLPNGGKLVVY